MELATLIHFILIGIESLLIISKLSVKIKIKCKAKNKLKIDEKIHKLNEKIKDLMKKQNGTNK